MSMNKVCPQFSSQAFKGLGLMGLLILVGMDLLGQAVLTKSKRRVNPLPSSKDGIF